MVFAPQSGKALDVCAMFAGVIGKAVRVQDVSQAYKMLKFVVCHMSQGHEASRQVLSHRLQPKLYCLFGVDSCTWVLTTMELRSSGRDMGNFCT